MWMHNGGIAGFTDIKMELHMSLPKELYNFPQGNTGMQQVRRDNS